MADHLAVASSITFKAHRHRPNLGVTHAYLDNAATTPVAPEVVKAMMDVYTSVRQSVFHTRAGRKAKALIETSRRTIASCWVFRPDHLFHVRGDKRTTTPSKPQ